MANRLFLGIAGLAGAASVTVDAAAAHLLAGDPHRLELAATGARYGLIHAAALLALALGARPEFWTSAACWCFTIGLVLFCASLDLLAAGAPPDIGSAAPWGGSAFILGWICVLAAAIRPQR